MQNFVSFLTSCDHLAGEQRAGCFTCFVFVVVVAVIVLCLILSVPWVDLQYMIVAFPGHTHLLSRSEIMKHFFMLNSNKHGISTAFKN